MNELFDIILSLDDIVEYVNATLIYLSDSTQHADKTEIIMYLSCVEEIINNTKDFIIKEKIKNET